MSESPPLALRLAIAPAELDDDYDEPGLVAEVSLVNESTTDLVVNGRLTVSRPGGPGELSFEITGPDGATVPFGARVNIGTPLADDFVRLPPGDAACASIDLRDYFAMHEPGHYRIRVTYENEWPGDEAGSPAWTGRLESDELDCEIPAT